jgi:hypothetical protein
MAEGDGNVTQGKRKKEKNERVPALKVPDANYFEGGTL